MSLHNSTEEALDSIDAAVFSGDSFHDQEGLDRLEYYMDRWQKEAVAIKAMIAETQSIERREQLTDEVCEVVAGCLGLHKDDINPTDNIKTDLKADSLDLVEIQMQLEVRFNCDLEGYSDARSFTVNAIVIALIQLKK